MRMKCSSTVNFCFPPGPDSQLQKVVAKFIYRVVPDLGAFDLTLQVTHGLEISQAQILYPLVYGVGYLLLLLMLASLIFSRRDFN